MNDTLWSLAQTKWRHQLEQNFPAFSKLAHGSDLAIVQLQVTDLKSEEKVRELRNS